MTREEKLKQQRAEENKNLLERVKRGESISRCSTQDTWWQPRQIIKKDPKALEKLYGEKK